MPNQQVPDVRVRLSAEGVDEVVRAFQQVSAAAQKSGKESGAGFKLLHQALDGIKELLPALSVGAAVAGMGALVKSALESADAIGKLSQKTGLSTETLSTLSFAAKTADVDFEGLSGALVKFDKTMGELDTGSGAAAGAVQRLFGSAKALDGLNTDQRFAKVAEALGKLPDGYQKAKAAMDFFGKTGANMIPLLNDLATQGFGNVEQHAKTLGLLLDHDVVDSATRARDTLTLLKEEATAAATQFVSGLLPALTQATDALAEVGQGTGKNGAKSAGAFAGEFIKSMTAGAIAVGELLTLADKGWELALNELVDRAKTAFDNIVTAAKAAGKAAAAAVRGDFAGADAALAAGKAGVAAANAALANRSAIRTEFAKDALYAYQLAIEKAQHALDATGTETGSGSTGTNGTGATGALGPESAKALLALTQQRLENELALTKQYAALQAAAEKAAYDNGLVSLGQYYDDRANAITDGSARELDVLTRERAALAASPLAVQPNATADQTQAAEIARRQQLAALDQKIALAKGDRDAQLQALSIERATAERTVAEKRLEIQDQIKTAEGDTYGAALDAINAQADALARLHLPPELIQQLGDVQRRTAAIAELTREGQNALGALSTAQASLQNGVDAGQLFPFQAVEQYDAAVQRVLPRLRELAIARLQAATTPDEIAAAQQFATEIDHLAISADEGAKRMAEFKSSLESGLTQDIATFFSTGIDQAHTFGEAMRGLAASVVQSLQQIVAQMLATIVVRKALGAIFGSGSEDSTAQAAAKVAIASIPLNIAGQAVQAGGQAVLEGAGALAAAAAGLLVAANAMKGASLFGFAEGGYTGDGGTYEPAGIVHRGEFVVNAQSVRQPGVLPMLAAINRGMHVPAVRALGSLPGYATGGLVTGATQSGSEPFDGELRVGLADGLVLEHMATTGGRRVMLRQMANNPKAFRAALGI